MKEARAVDVLVAAFHDDPLRNWLFPGGLAGEEAARCLFRPLVRRAADTGGLDGADDVAVAVWVVLAAGEDPYGGGEGELPEALHPHVARLEAYAELVGVRHPTGRPHLYLPFLGVLPGRRGGGLGGALLRRRLAAADADGVPVYLEASSPRGRPLYERHGFRATGDPVVLPEGPPVLPMWREPGRPQFHLENHLEEESER